MAATYVLERWEWTHAEYDRMGWHDATIHALAYLPDTFELVLDIDYIFECVAPAPGEQSYQFWLAPATLVFENTSHLRIDLEPLNEISIQGLLRGEPEPTRPGYEGPSVQWPWTVDCHEGQITLHATGFRQVIRRPPILTQQPTLGRVERGGLSFARVRDR